jgi:hypothetical protein
MNLLARDDMQGKRLELEESVTDEHSHGIITTSGLWIHGKVRQVSVIPSEPDEFP